MIRIKLPTIIYVAIINCLFHVDFIIFGFQKVNFNIVFYYEAPAMAWSYEKLIQVFFFKNLFLMHFSMKLKHASCFSIFKELALDSNIDALKTLCT